MRHLLATSILIAAIAGAACGATQPPPAARPTPTKRVDPATAGMLTGTVSFAGRRPAPETLHINEDPVCLQAFGNKLASDAVLISADGGLQNAFVYI